MLVTMKVINFTIQVKPLALFEDTKHQALYGDMLVCTPYSKRQFAEFASNDYETETSAVQSYNTQNVIFLYTMRL